MTIDWQFHVGTCAHVLYFPFHLSLYTELTLSSFHLPPFSRVGFLSVDCRRAHSCPCSRTEKQECTGMDWSKGKFENWEHFAFRKQEVDTSSQEV